MMHCPPDDPVSFSGAGLHELIGSWRTSRPTALAVTAGSESLTYAQLLEKAEALAGRLRRVGAGPDSLVGVVVDRSYAAVVGILGTLLSGAGYVAVDAELPDERIGSIVADSAMRVVTGVDGQVRRATGATYVPIDGPPTRNAGTSLPVPHPNQAAYAIFTSGSTGAPKGVVVSHAALARSTMARFGRYPKPGVYLTLAPLSTDSAVAGLFFTLAAGGHLVLPDEDEVRDAQLLADLVVRTQVSHIDGLPSQYAMLLRFHPESLATLRCVILGGEALPSPVVRQHLALNPAARLHNEYGPTEATVWATMHTCGPEDCGSDIPIGTPYPGVRVQVLADDLTEAAPDEVGEIYISGRSLALGYLARPSLTAERFVAKVGPDGAGERMYRTGDLGRTDDRGRVYYHGRRDRLVKVRGFRVELDELELRLLEHTDVVNAAVVACPGATGVRLVAHVALADGSALTARELSTFVARRLPAYMRPAVWRRHPAIPVTATGKVDLRLLEREATTIGTDLSG
jgi:amino acid adenylation domain-containing protein